MQEEQQAMRKNKENGEPLNWEDYKKMEFTYHVRKCIFTAKKMKIYFYILKLVLA